MENTSDSFMSGPLLFCMKIEKSVYYSVPDNNAIVGWKSHGTHRFGKEYGIQRSWKRMVDSVKKDKDGFIEVPEQLEIPFE